MTNTAPAAAPAAATRPAPAIYRAIPIGNPDEGRGTTPIAAIRSCRRRGWNGPIEVRAADGVVVMTAAAEWDGSPVW